MQTGTTLEGDDDGANFFTVTYSYAFANLIHVLLSSVSYANEKNIRPSTVEVANEVANTLFDTVDVLFDTVDREGVGNEEGANLLLLPPLWSA